MSSHLTANKIAHPVQSRETAERNRRSICDARGYCGPFINITYYGHYPDASWHGIGECIICCNTCRVEVEQRKRNAASAAASTPVHLLAEIDQPEPGGADSGSTAG